MPTQLLVARPGAETDVGRFGGAVNQEQTGLGRRAQGGRQPLDPADVDVRELGRHPARRRPATLAPPLLRHSVVTEIEQVVLVVTADRRPAGGADRRQHPAALRSATDQIAAHQDLVGLQPLDVRQHRCERRHVAVYVGQNGDEWGSRHRDSPLALRGEYCEPRRTRARPRLSSRPTCCRLRAAPGLGVSQRHAQQACLVGTSPAPAKPGGWATPSAPGRQPARIERQAVPRRRQRMWMPSPPSHSGSIFRGTRVARPRPGGGGPPPGR